MYKLIISDDEDVIREGLAGLVNWKELGYELVACLRDGSEVIDYIENNPADVLFTDIKMNTVSGMDLARYVFENRPEIKVVILSGYKEFDYARQAIDYGVESYLLKPTRFNEVVSTFAGIRQKLDMERESMEKKRQYEELLPLLQEQLVADLFMGTLKHAENMDKRLAVLNLKTDLEKYPCYAVTLKIRDCDRYLSEQWQYGKESFKTAVGNFLKPEQPEFHCFYTFSTKDILNILMVSLKEFDRNVFQERIEQWFYLLQKTISDELSLMIELVEGVYYYNLYRMTESGRSFSDEKIKECTIDVLAEFEKPGFSKEESPAKMLVLKVLQYIRENYNKDISLEEAADRIYLHPAYLSRIFKQQTGESFTDYLTKVRMQKAEELLAQKPYRTNDIAAMVGYKNSKYFCKVFKLHTGCSPKEFSYKYLFCDVSAENE